LLGGKGFNTLSHSPEHHELPETRKFHRSNILSGIATVEK
jgi:hypothetical protein